MSADLSPDDLGILDPEGAVVTLSTGLRLDVRPLVVRQVVPFVRALGPARYTLADESADLWDVIADYGDEVTEALSVALSMPVSAVVEMDPCDFLDALRAVLEVNRRFFASWLIRPALRRQVRMAQETAEAGQTSSNLSSVPDIP